jgi:hypothetical protein
VVKNSPKKDNLEYKDADGKDDIDYDKVESLEVLHGTAGKDEDEGGGAAEPGAGDEVEITTKRGKTIKCTILELTDDEIVYEDKDGKDDIARDRVESIKVVKKAKAAKPAAKVQDHRGAAATKGKDKEQGRRPRRRQAHALHAMPRA